MANFILSHAVKDLDHWLALSDQRIALFSTFCDSHSVFIDQEQNHVCLLIEDGDLEKFRELHASEEAAANRARAGVVDPVKICVVED